MNNRVRSLIRLAIEEDIGSGDVTSELTISPEIYATAHVYTKESCILCGSVLIDLIFEELGWPVMVEYEQEEGAELSADTCIATIHGPAQFILTAERTILNFLQHLSGVATKAHEIVSAANGITVLDTRKTTPGWRILEKYAARVGGCRNHRESLSDMILVKNNHIDINQGDFDKFMSKVNSDKPIYMPVEIEVRNMSELACAVSSGAQIVMLDNMSDVELKDALNWIKENAPHIEVEVSGRIDEERLKTLSLIGVTTVSTSAMVTRSNWIDIAMRIEVDDEPEHEHCC